MSNQFKIQSQFLMVEVLKYIKNQYIGQFYCIFYSV